MTHDSAPAADTSHASHGGDTFVDTSHHNNHHDSFNEHQQTHHGAPQHEDHHHHSHRHKHHRHDPDPPYDDSPETQPLYPPPAYSSTRQLANDDGEEYYDSPIGHGNMWGMRRVCGLVFISLFLIVWFGMFVFIVSNGIRMMRMGHP